MRVIAGLLGVVTLVVGDNVPAAGPASSGQACSCTEQLSQTISQWKEANDGCLRDLTTANQEAAKHQSNFAQCETNHGVTRQHFEQFKVDADKKAGGCKTELEQCQVHHKKGAGDSEALKSEVVKLQTEKERLAGEVRAEVERRKLAEKDLTEAQASAMADASKKAEALLHKGRAEMQVAIAKYSEQLAEKDAEMERMLESTSKIYSAQQFWRTVDQSKTVGLAFLGYARNRLVKVVGTDTYKLVTLQTQIWYIKARGTWTRLYEPVRSQAVTFYTNHAQKEVEKITGYVLRRSQQPTKQVQLYFQKGLGYVDAYMEGVINNLSSVNPQVRDLFPNNFYDRCYAFTFVALVLYFTSQAIQYAFNWVWANAVLRVIWGKKKLEKGITGNTKKARGGQRAALNPRNKPASAPTTTEKAKAR